MCLMTWQLADALAKLRELEEAEAKRARDEEHEEPSAAEADALAKAKAEGEAATHELGLARYTGAGTRTRICWRTAMLRGGRSGRC